MDRPAAQHNVANRKVGATGYGMLGLSRPFAPMEYDAAAELMKAALENGSNFWNGSQHYGPPEANSLHVLKHYFDKYPQDADKVVVSVKGAYSFTTHEPDCSPEGIRSSVDEALRVLDGTKKIDIFGCSRVDPKVPIEDAIKTLAELVSEGKIGGIGLSEVNAATIRRAHAVHPITAVEIELSLFTTDALDNGVAQTCKELGIAIIAYSPLSRGFLSGQIKSFQDLDEKDFRRMLPRFQPQVFDHNMKLVEAVKAIAERKGVTAAQVALAWVRYQGAIPIPGATKMKNLLDNCKEAALEKADLDEIDQILAAFPIQGQRYGGKHEAMLNK